MFIINTFSTCFGHHYVHLQENKTCVTARVVLLKMGIMMPETCWESVDNKLLTVASCWFSLSLHNLLTMHGHRNLKLYKRYWSLCGPSAYSFEDERNRFQNKVLRNIVDALRCIRKAKLHRDFRMEMVTTEIGKFAKKHEERLLHHVNVEAIQLIDNSELGRRLNKIEQV